MTRALRLFAVLLAIGAVADPSLSVERPQLPAVEVRLGASAAANPDAVSLEKMLIERHAPAAKPAAIVMIDPASSDIESLPDNVPVSVVDGSVTADPVRIRGVSSPSPVMPGQVAVINAEIESTAVQSGSSIVTLEAEGVELSRTNVQWSNTSERRIVQLRYLPGAPGLSRLRVMVRASEDVSGPVVDSADIAILAESRVLRVFTYEPRPSWALTFVRRALEADPVFSLAASVQASRGIEVRAGNGPPARLTAAALEPFDAVVVGAPEALSNRDVNALETFARERGGTVILLPDRRPSGPYLSLLPADGFDEVLTDAPVALEGPAASGLEASELAVARRPGPGAAVIASTRHRRQLQPIIVSWPIGAGRVVFSGALDAWRYRGAEGGGFNSVWTSIIANVAASAPRALSVSVSPSLTTALAPVVVRAAVPPSALRAVNGRVEMPPIGAMLIGPDGAAEAVRLWPTPEAGVFEGRASATATGRYSVRASSGELVAETPLLVATDVRHPPAAAAEGLEEIARATGGVAVSASDLTVLHEHLRSLPPRHGAVTSRPARSAWWMAAFAAALCAEWAVRRRRGLR